MFKKVMSLTTLNLMAAFMSFLSNMIISKYFGTSEKVDFFFYFISLVGFLSFFSGPLTETLIPKLHKLYRESEHNASQFFSQVLVSVFALVIIFFPFLILFSYQISNTSVFSHLLLNPLNLFLLVVCGFLTVLSVFLSGLLDAIGKYFQQVASKLLSALLAIGFLIYFVLNDVENTLLLYYIFGLVFLVSLQFISLKKSGIKITKFDLNFFKRNELQMFFIMLFTFFLSALYLVYEKTTLSKFGIGILSSYSYSQKIMQIPQVIFVTSLLSILWNKTLEKAHNQSEKQVSNFSIRSAVLVSWLSLFVCIIVFFFCREIIYLLFYRGAFNEESLILTSDALKNIIWALPFIVFYSILSKNLLAYNKKWDILVIGVVHAMILAGFAILSLGTKQVIFLYWGQFFAYAFCSVFASIKVNSNLDSGVLKYFTVGLKTFWLYLVFLLIVLYFIKMNYGEIPLDVNKSYILTVLVLISIAILSPLVPLIKRYQKENINV
jgi:putative peptidoglycan lipid II flippase